MPAVCRVIMGVSGSPRNLPALRYAADLARGRGARLVPLLTWVPPGGELADRRCPSRHLREAWEQAAWERLLNALTTAFGGVPTDVATQLLTVRGEAGWVLVHAASRATDLLVIGTGRHGRVARLTSGKVSRYCLARPAARSSLCRLRPWTSRQGTACTPGRSATAHCVPAN